MPLRCPLGWWGCGPPDADPKPRFVGVLFFVKTPPERRLCSFRRDLRAPRPRSPPLHIAAFRFARARSVRYKPSLFPAEFPRPHADILFRRAALFRQKSLAPFFPDPPSPLLNASFLSGQAARRFVSRKKNRPLSSHFPDVCALFAGKSRSPVRGKIRHTPGLSAKR